MYGIMGASSQLGRATLRHALEAVPAAQIVAAARTPEKLARFANQGVVVRCADYDEPESLEQAFAGVRRLLLVPSIAMPPQRVQQYVNAIDAARSAGVEHLLHYSIVGTAIDAPFAIMPFLVFAESALRTSGMQWTILRNGPYADPIADWIPEIVAMGTIPYPTGSGRSSYVSRDDIGRAGAAALTTDGHAGKVYDLTGQQAITTAELCEIVAQVTDRPVAWRDATDDDYVRVSVEGGTPEPFAQLLLSMYLGIRDGFFDVAPGDIEALTGSPAEPLESFFERRVAASRDAAARGLAAPKLDSDP